MENKFDFNDIVIVPESLSKVSHRHQVNIFDQHGNLPIMVSPMDTVVNGGNYQEYQKEGFTVCTPRGIQTDDSDIFTSVSLEDFEDFIVWYEGEDNAEQKFRVLIDIANGHMERLYTVVKKFQEVRHSPFHELMIGNVANPKTFELFAQLDVDYIRVGIGGGSGCLTSANTGVHYPMASLINEIYQIKKNNNYKTKIVADGGFRNYDEIIKALVLGADYVMLGGILNKCLESCGQTKLFKKFNLSPCMSDYIWYNHPYMRKFMYKSFRGMSTKQVQKSWDKKKLKTSEGISKVNKIEYTLSQWTENFSDYLRSAMSYTNSFNLQDFKESKFVFITNNAFKRYGK